MAMAATTHRGKLAVSALVSARVPGLVPALVAVGCALGGCAGSGAPATRVPPRAAVDATHVDGERAVPPGGFRSPTGRDHPLAGAILRTRDGDRLDWQQLIGALGQARAVLLGEKHDNPDHHLLQAELYSALLDGRPAPAAVFEMLDATGQSAVTEASQHPDRRPTRIAEAVQWKTSGWPPFEIYAPVFARVLAAGAPVFAAGLPRAQTMGLARGEPLAAVGVFDAAVAERYGIDQPLPPAQHEEIRALMQAAHCGMLPDAMLDGMVRIQRMRDALLADAVRLGIEQQGRAVVFAGAGHVRRDRAVPALLAQVAVPDTFSVLLREVGEQTDPAHYLDADTAAAYDVVILTAALPPEDHCAELRARFKGHSAPQDGDH